MKELCSKSSNKFYIYCSLLYYLFSLFIVNLKRATQHKQLYLFVFFFADDLTCSLVDIKSGQLVIKIRKAFDETVDLN